MTDERWGWFAYRRDGTRDYYAGGDEFRVDYHFHTGEVRDEQGQG